LTLAHRLRDRSFDDLDLHELSERAHADVEHCVKLVGCKRFRSVDALSDIDEERLQMALFTLPDEFRLPVVMFYFEQLGYEAIAEQLSIPKGTVMSRLHRGKKHLRRMLFSDRHDPTFFQSRQLRLICPLREIRENQQC